jgi:hypothetical protein
MWKANCTALNCSVEDDKSDTYTVAALNKLPFDVTNKVKAMYSMELYINM